MSLGQPAGDSCVNHHCHPELPNTNSNQYPVTTVGHKRGCVKTCGGIAC